MNWILLWKKKNEDDYPVHEDNLNESAEKRQYHCVINLAHIRKNENRFRVHNIHLNIGKDWNHVIVSYLDFENDA